jgi:hypothetical protein
MTTIPAGRRTRDEWFTTPITEAVVRGALDLERTAHGERGPGRTGSTTCWSTARRPATPPHRGQRPHHRPDAAAGVRPIHERTPGPAAPDLSALREGRLAFAATGDPADPTRLTLEVIRDELARITAERSATDPTLAYLDGRELYGEADFAELPLPDRLHADAASHRRIGERFAGRVLDGFGSAQWKTDFRRISSV